MTIEDHYRVLSPKLTNWLVASGSSYAEACDLVQSTFLKLWKMRDDLRDSDSAVSGLAFTIARNLRKNLARDDKRLTFVADMSPEGQADGSEPQVPAGAASVDGRQMTMPSDVAYLRKRLKAAFAELPPILREAYTLFQIGELSIQEIARETGVSESLVKVRIFRAKEKLKTILADLRVTF